MSIESDINDSSFDSADSSDLPTRTCVACGKKGDKTSFLRFVMSPDKTVIMDVKGKLQSRGVYACAERACINKMLKKKVFKRFFGEDCIESSYEDIINSMESSIGFYIFSLMNLALKSKKLIHGSGAVFDEISRGRVCLVLISKDAGESLKSKVEYANEHKGIEYITIGEKAKVSERLGLKETAVMALIDKNLAQTLEKYWNMYNNVVLWSNENK